MQYRRADVVSGEAMGPNGDRLPDNWFIRAGYRPRSSPEYFDDTVDSSSIFQPDVYPFAAHLARRYGAKYIIDIGCGRGERLVVLAHEFSVIGVDFGSNVAYSRRHHGTGLWLELDLEVTETLPLPPEVISESVVICSDVIEHLVDPGRLLFLLRSLQDLGAPVVISTPERDRTRGAHDEGPPANPCHIREWTLAEFLELLEWAGLEVAFSGLTASNSGAWAKETTLAVCERQTSLKKAPGDFRVLALMPVYNEEDIVVPSVAALLDQGIEVHLLDHGSTDKTFERAQSLAGRGRLTWERLPSAPPAHRWMALLNHIDEVGARSSADWCIYHPVDQRRSSPWPEVRLRDALYHVDRSGFNAVAHTVLNFRPVDETYRDGEDFECHFRYFQFSRFNGYCPQIDTWKNRRYPVALSTMAGREAVFSGRRVFPYNFLLKHYPFRTQHQGECKLRDRSRRWDRHERKRGWPVHEDHQSECDLFRWDPADLSEFGAKFGTLYVTERLGAVGIARRKADGRVAFSAHAPSGLFA